MKDPYNPTPEEIEAWAYSNKLEPTQDWNITITTVDNATLLLKLTSDPKCKKSKYFLKTLYFLVGDIVGKKGSPKPEIDSLMKVFSESEQVGNRQVHRWVRLSRHLINHPDEFDYNKWCEGGLVNDIA